MRVASTLRTLAAALAAIAVAPAGIARPQRLPEFAGSIAVRERVVHFDAALLPQLESAGRRADVDFLVLEDGVPRDLVRRPPDEAPAPVRHLIWLDPELASPRTLASAARSLAKVAPELAAGGSLELAVVGRGSITRERDFRAAGLAARLLGLAGTVEESAGGARPPLECRLAALDRLAAEIAELDTGEPGALWLPVDGWPLAPDELAAFDRDAEPQPGASSPAAVVERAGRILASYGWALFPVAAVPANLDLAAALRRAREDEYAPPPPPGERKSIFYLFRKRWPKRRAVPSRSAFSALELATDLRLLPLGRLARLTSGSLVGEPRAIAQRAARFGGRRRLVVAEPDSPPGELRRLEVVWSGGDGRALPAFGWVRTGTPVEVAAVRLAALAAGRLDPRFGLGLRAEPASPPGAPGKICFADAKGRGWLRLSRWRAASPRPELGTPVQLAVDAAPCLPFEVPPGPGDRLLLEDVENGEWGAWQLES